eukprot:GHVP01030094.1.p1 GENE.GHVP01030094.1~~GHVP01030094.1.p1  ORF type:complete len:544 (-),score=112.12 GHVP01030094.1:4674-6305(-)
MSSFIPPTPVSVSVAKSVDNLLYEQFKLSQRSCMSTTVQAVAIGNNASGGRCPLAVADGSRILLFDAKKSFPSQQPQAEKVITRINSEVTCLTLREDNKALLVGDAEGSVYVFDNKGNRLRTFYSHSGRVTECKFIDNKILVSAGEDGNLVVRKIAGEKEKPLLTWKAAAPISSLHRIYLKEDEEPEFGTWSVGCADGMLKILRLNSDTTSEGTDDKRKIRAKLICLFRHQKEITSSFVTDDGLLVVSSDSCVFFWNLAGANGSVDESANEEHLVHSFFPHVLTVTNMVPIPNPKITTFMTASADRTVKVWTISPSSNFNLKCIASAEMKGGISSLSIVRSTPTSSDEPLCESIKPTLLEGIGAIVIGCQDGEWVVRTSRTSKERQVWINRKLEKIRKRQEEASVISICNEKRRKQFTDVDHLLRQFQFQAAWDKVLQNEVDTIASVFLELRQSNKLHYALQRNDYTELIPTLDFIEKLLILSPIAKEFAVDLLDSLIDSNRLVLNELDEGPVLDKFEAIRKLLVFEVGVCSALQEVRGYLVS